MIVLREKLKRWSYSYTKETMRRRWEKHEEDVSVLITPEKTKEFDASQASRNAVFILGELGGNTVVEINPSKYTLVRDYLIAHIMIDNANHAGVVSSMTVEEFQRARVEDERYVVRVLKHKTVDTHGPARVVLTKLLYSYINVFIKQMRLPVALSDVKQALFLSWLVGNQIESNQTTKALSSIFKKAGIKGPVHHTLYRKSAISQCHARHKEISSNLVDLMAHRECTAEKYDRLSEKNKLSVKASKKLHGIMRNCEENDKELSTRKAVNGSSECELVTADSPGTERAPWKEESLQALLNLFAEEISLQSVIMSLVREKIQSDPILCKESPKRVYVRIRALALQIPN